jgi:hypothetical protein
MIGATALGHRWRCPEVDAGQWPLLPVMESLA